MYWEHEENNSTRIYIDSVKRAKIASRGGHIPNKKESACLRRIMSQTGLTEAQVREFRKYRQDLAEAARPKPSKYTKRDKYYKNKIRWACRDSGFWPLHPDSLGNLQKSLKYNFYGLTLKEVIRDYIDSRVKFSELKISL